MNSIFIATKRGKRFCLGRKTQEYYLTRSKYVGTNVANKSVDPSDTRNSQHQFPSDESQGFNVANAPKASEKIEILACIVPAEITHRHALRETIILIPPLVQDGLFDENTQPILLSRYEKLVANFLTPTVLRVLIADQIL